jgi:hypothetical protein
MTFWGLAFVIGVFVFAFFLLFKLYPPYLEDFKVKTALESLSKQSDIGSMSRADIAASLEKRFDIDNVSEVDPKKDLTVETRGRVKIISISYEKIVPIVGNVSILLQFDHQKEVRSSE